MGTLESTIRLLQASTLCAFAAIPVSLSADSLAMTPVASSSLFPTDESTVGFTFTAQTDFTITALGVWDEGGDTITGQHEVQLTASSLVGGVDALVDVYGNDLPDELLIGDFLFHPLAVPFNVTAGQSYGILADISHFEQIPVSVASEAAVDPRISDVQGWVVPDSTFEWTEQNPIQFGANFLIEDAGSSPEPGAGSLLGSALLALPVFVRLVRRNGAPTPLPAIPPTTSS